MDITSRIGDRPRLDCILNSDFTLIFFRRLLCYLNNISYIPLEDSGLGIQDGRTCGTNDG
jgi:hypothetical protein